MSQQNIVTPRKVNVNALGWSSSCQMSHGLQSSCVCLLMWMYPEGLLILMPNVTNVTVGSNYLVTQLDLMPDNCHSNIKPTNSTFHRCALHPRWMLWIYAIWSARWALFLAWRGMHPGWDFSDLPPCTNVQSHKANWGSFEMHLTTLKLSGIIISRHCYNYTLITW